ncbi:MAG: tRNA-dihydrouridine synthase family protein [Kiritimatiellia bacterium]
MPESLRKLYHLPAGQTPLLFLAPMAGFTSAPTRKIAREHGADMTFTEMTSDMGLIHEQPKSWYLLERFEGEEPVVAHLYGSAPESLAEAAHKIEEHGGFAGIDLNAGCPVRKITRNGAGSELIKNPGQIFNILSAMRKTTSLPLSIKTRLGPHPHNIAVFDILKAAEDAGADAITVHARFTSQGHKGDADLALLAEVKSKALIPVTGNGGIRSARDAWRMFQETGVNAIMPARCAIGNPWLFSDIRKGLAAAVPPPVYEPTRGRPRRNLDMVRALLLRHLYDEKVLLERTRNIYKCPDNALSIESTLATSFRCHLFRYLHGMKGSSFLRSHMSRIRTFDQIIEAVDACIERERIFRADRPKK